MMENFLHYKDIKLKKKVKLQSKKGIFPRFKFSVCIIWYLCTCEAKMYSYQ